MVFSWRLSGLCSIRRLPCELLSEGRGACLSQAQMRRGAFCLERQSLAIKWGAQFPPEDKCRPGRTRDLSLLTQLGYKGIFLNL